MYFEEHPFFVKNIKYFVIKGVIFTKNIAFLLRSDIIKSNLVLLAGQG